MIFISAGHNNKGIKTAPGAVANGFREADLAVDFRNLVIDELSRMSIPFISDKDTETLAEYLKRIKTGSGSVVLEIHFDAAVPTATGTTALVGEDADRLDKAFAKEIADVTAMTLGIKNRGVKSEAESHRGRLALIRKEGIVSLIEICFITNKTDMILYTTNKKMLAIRIAQVLVKYEKMI